MSYFLRISLSAIFSRKPAGFVKLNLRWHHFLLIINTLRTRLQDLAEAGHCKAMYFAGWDVFQIQREKDMQGERFPF